MTEKQKTKKQAVAQIKATLEKLKRDVSKLFGKKDVGLMLFYKLELFIRAHIEKPYPALNLAMQEALFKKARSLAADFEFMVDMRGVKKLHALRRTKTNLKKLLDQFEVFLAL